LHSFRGSQYDRIARLTYARVYEASHYVKWPPGPFGAGDVAKGAPALASASSFE